jgi:hypothetical protein
MTDEPEIIVAMATERMEPGALVVVRIDRLTGIVTVANTVAATEPPKREGRWLIVGYVPRRDRKVIGGKCMGTFHPTRCDGGYIGREGAEGVAKLYREQPLHPDEQIHIVRMSSVAKPGKP